MDNASVNHYKREIENGDGSSDRVRERERVRAESVVSPLLSANCPRASWPRSKSEMYCRILCAVGKLSGWVGQLE